MGVSKGGSKGEGRTTHMLPFPDGSSISTGSVLPDRDIFLNRDCAQAKGGFYHAERRGP